MRDWWRDAIICQICPRSFMDVTGRRVGNLRGITKRLSQVPSGLSCGKTICHDLTEPVLACRSEMPDQTLTCVFNLLPKTAIFRRDRPEMITGLARADLGDQPFTLPGNGFAYLQHQTALNLTNAAKAAAI